VTDCPQGGGDGYRDAPVAVRLHAPSRHPVGELVPVRVEVVNSGDHDVCLVGVLDGSEHGIRYPHYRPSVTVDGRVVGAPEPPDDPLVGPIRPADIRHVAPGTGFDPTDRTLASGYLPLATFVAFRPTVPGVHRFTLRLDTTGPRPDSWLGRFNQTVDDSLRALLSAVPSVSVSGTVDVDIVAR
jgi:hypothetical protein